MFFAGKLTDKVPNGQGSARVEEIDKSLRGKTMRRPNRWGNPTPVFCTSATELLRILVSKPTF